MNPYRHINRRRRERRGATAVEFAMVAPAFAIVLTVCVEFSRLSMLRNISQNACYEAARLAMAEGATLDDAFERFEEVLFRLGAVRATLFINDSEKVVQGNQVISYTEGTEIDFDTQQIIARIEIPLNQNTFVLPGSMLGDNVISSRVTMNTERYRGFFDANQIN
ncbi:MAG: TadE family protein [Planctomycetota bacterium]